MSCGCGQKPLRCGMCGRAGCFVESVLYLVEDVQVEATMMRDDKN